jgi:hypothetical protein
LKPGGRLGFISSSTFFRTGSGENLRIFLKDHVSIESVIDFGDLQLFEGVTTYPAILTLRKADGEAHGTLAFLNLKDELPQELDRRFNEQAVSMPRARLGAGSWQFENDALAKLRTKITQGRKTLGEVYGQPLYGIKTGLNEAFVIDTQTRDRLVKADPKSAELLKPFLRGENIKRWRVESEGLWLINTPKGKVNIEAYPPIRDWLLPFKAELEKRATKQEWWELQQAQLAYQEKLGAGTIAWAHFQAESSFTLVPDGAFLNNKCFFLPRMEKEIVALLVSKVLWFQLITSGRMKRGGYVEAEAQYIEVLAVPTMTADDTTALSKLAMTCSNSSVSRLIIQSDIRARILDLAPPEHRKLSGRLENWHELDFAAFLAEVKKTLRVDIPLKRQGEWKDYLAENRAEVERLTADIETAEREIDRIVYRLFDLTAEEITLLEASLEGQY